MGSITVCVWWFFPLYLSYSLDSFLTRTYQLCLQFFPFGFSFLCYCFCFSLCNSNLKYFKSHLRDFLLDVLLWSFNISALCFLCVHVTFDRTLFYVGLTPIWMLISFLVSHQLLVCLGTLGSNCCFRTMFNYFCFVVIFTFFSSYLWVLKPPPYC